MHTLLKVSMVDVEAANEAIETGKLQKIVEKVSSVIKPEFTFFTADQGYRTGIMVFDLKDVSLIPTIAEPFFMGLNAKVEFLPGMTLDELSKGLNDWNKVAPTYEAMASH